ncbi:MAG: MgtC/SapB family protein [Christensenellaceae bacterium]|nr:MgtC/SapB family protein [Christensenellaceae bacterium]
MVIREVTHKAIIVRIILSTIIGGIIGIERGSKNRPAGLRTHMLVCLGATVVMITNQYVEQLFNTGDPLRLGAQVISGIGFLGAGSILVTRRNQIKGLTTAAGLWAAACIGLAIGIGFYELAIPGGVTIFLILTVLQKFDAITRQKSTHVESYIELKGKEDMGPFVRYMRDNKMALYDIQVEHEDMIEANIGFAFIVTIKSMELMNRDKIIKIISKAPNLEYFEEL